MACPGVTPVLDGGVESEHTQDSTGGKAGQPRTMMDEEPSGLLIQLIRDSSRRVTCAIGGAVSRLGVESFGLGGLEEW